MARTVNFETDGGKPKPNIDIIIATYNSAQTIVPLLQSIARQSYSQYRCFVIDDCSQDETVQIVRKKFPGVQVMTQTQNQGPAQARGQAIRQGRSPYLVILDADSYLPDPDWLSKAVRELERDPHVGQLAAMIVSAYDPDIILDCGIFGEGPFFGGLFYQKRKQDVLEKYKKARRVLGACTAGTILRRDVYERVGGFDPKYFYPSEDLDLSLRIHLAGFDVRYCPKLVVAHQESASIGKNPRRKQYLFQRNSLLILLEHYPLKHAVKKGIIFFWRVFFYPFWQWRGQKKERRILVRKLGRMIAFFLWVAPRVISKRMRVNRFRKRSRQYLLDLNQNLQRKTALRFPLKSLIFLLTNHCNARCQMCFLDQEINQKAPLFSFAEIQTFLLSCKELANIVLSGGEPFLHQGLVRICKLLIEHTNPVITIPTNGSLPQEIYEACKQILSAGAKKLVISFSLDGRPVYHDQNRGFPGLFSKVQESYSDLVRLQKIFGPRLELQVNTCVTQENIGELAFLRAYLEKRMEQARWMIEPVRGAFNPDTAQALSLGQWREIHKQIKSWRRRGNSSGLDQSRRLFVYGIKALEQKRQPVPCAGGAEFLSLDWAGNLAACEMLPAIVNIRELDYDINNLGQHRAWQERCQEIRSAKCYCTHFCWLDYSLARQRKSWPGF